MKVRNVFIIFIVSGFWHGANWTFIFWGLINALYFLPLMLLKRNRIHTDIIAEGRIMPTLLELLQMFKTFMLFSFCQLMFRAPTVEQAFAMLKRMVSKSLIASPIRDLWTINTDNHIFFFAISVSILIVVEWFQREKQHGLQLDPVKFPKLFRWSMYYVLIIACIMMRGMQEDFIYFQF